MLNVHIQVLGVKGLCVLACHRPFNLVKGVVIDPMHTVFLRVVLLLALLWFDQDHRSEEYSIRKKASLVACCFDLITKTSFSCSCLNVTGDCCQSRYQIPFLDPLKE